MKQTKHRNQTRTKSYYRIYSKEGILDITSDALKHVVQPLQRVGGLPIRERERIKDKQCGILYMNAMCHQFSINFISKHK